MSKQPVGTPDVFARAVSAEVRAEMGRQNVSARELARRVKRSGPYVQDRLNENKTFNLNDLEVISGALGLTPSEFIDRVIKNAPNAVGVGPDPLATE